MGAGIFVTTGRVAHSQAGCVLSCCRAAKPSPPPPASGNIGLPSLMRNGLWPRRPAVIISFAIAALSALLSALCYAEFATEVPITGGAFSYTTLTFGPLVGWLVGTNLIIPHIVGNAGVLRNFSAYLAQLLNVNGKTDLQVRRAGLFSCMPVPRAGFPWVACGLQSRVCGCAGVGARARLGLGLPCLRPSAGDDSPADPGHPRDVALQPRYESTFCAVLLELCGAVRQHMHYSSPAWCCAHSLCTVLKGRVCPCSGDGLHVTVILFVIGAGLTQARPEYMQPFAPFGIEGIFNGATYSVFLLYRG